MILIFLLLLYYQKYQVDRYELNIKILTTCLIIDNSNISVYPFSGMRLMKMSYFYKDVFFKIILIIINLLLF